MRQSHFFVQTLREVPAEAEVPSHRLMLRAGMIRQVVSGVYSYLPLGYRVLRKIEAIVREEMDRAGAQEVLLPAVQPASLWQESGRWDDYGKELLRFEDRHQRMLVLGPTHEEVITDLVRTEVRSYRQLPMTLYQIQTKFRDEVRPRFGVMRAREFIMKDAYSFDVDEEGLDRSYRAMYQAYEQIFRRCGLEFRVVQADPGAIGGEGGSHEFMVLSEVGEDTILVCPACDYAANVELASGKVAGEDGRRSVSEKERFLTPGAKTIEELRDRYGLDPETIIKVLVYRADDRPVAVAIRGNDEVNEVKLKRLLGARRVELADEETVRALTGTGFGSVGPMNLNMPLVVDDAVASMPEGVAGGNEPDVHYRHVVPGRDFNWDSRGDIRTARAGDRCVRCGAPLEEYRGIEVGHVFKLGTKYSEALSASFLDERGVQRPVIMGCYGIGVSRLIAAAVEQHHDDKGIMWPMPIAPFHVHVLPVNLKDAAQRDAAEQLCTRLEDAGIEVLLDDRDERPGVKFNDADLMGIPIQLIVGKRISEGLVEMKRRKTGEVTLLSPDEAVRAAVEAVRSV
ncbi:proline--tRNA ligase [Kyrpidia tusciae]|uniref:Proline--tRNA ligase n=1 Tax=Kyrpidia tusciae (strain DSM 2912 / NBRC 15312 / T2) TaxID=562970 RepID=D5WPI7_KYRT2|nr:proline--tRNA ligase [Kyrpidia tusciae]ADG06246.1 prolyl-tRNA synthetase [Kyrpidia tusciae DSM 2912]